MNKFFSLILILSSTINHGMENPPEFSYELMPKTHGPQYVLTNQSHSVPFYQPANRDNGFDFGMHQDYQDKTLHDAVDNNNLKLASDLLRSGKYTANTLNGSGKTPLFFVKSLEMATLLLRHNANVNVAEQCRGTSPLHYIVQRGDAESIKIVKFIVAHKAKVNALSWGYTTPLAAAKCGSAEMIALLKELGAEDSYETLDVILKAKREAPEKAQITRD